MIQPKNKIKNEEKFRSELWTWIPPNVNFKESLLKPELGWVNKKIVFATTSSLDLFIEYKTAPSRGRLAQWLSVRFVNLSAPGDRGSNLAEGFIFSDAFLREYALSFDGNFQQSDGQSITQPIEERSCCETPSLSERDVARINWPLWRHPWCMTSYVTYYDILHKNEPATCHNNKPQSLICDGDRPLIGSRPRTDRRFLSYQYDEVAEREQRAVGKGGGR